MRRAWALASLASLALAAAPACGDQSTFTLGRDLELCVDNLPTACAASAGCVLDDAHYLSGTFPGSGRFIARTDGETTLDVQLFFTDERAPGTELRVIAHEPSCSEQMTYDSEGQDIFRLAGSNGILSVPLTVQQAGDHLVEFVSDAYCSYSLKLTP